MKTPKLLCRFAVAAWVMGSSAVMAGTFEQAKSAHQAGDYATALKLVRPLADKGDAEAQYLLGRMYEKGHGVGRDLAEAGKWYRKAAECNHAEAQYRVAVGYAYGAGGLPQDDAEAGKWLQRSAERGYKKAQKMLAQAYARGMYGMKQDKKLAQYWQDKADGKEPKP